MFLLKVREAAFFCRKCTAIRELVVKMFFNSLLEAIPFFV